MWCLELAHGHAHISRVLFASKERATEELEALKPKMGRDIYELNKEGGPRTHTIIGDCETLIVNLQHLWSASVVDPLAHNKMQLDVRNFDEELKLDGYRKQCAIRAEYGLKS